jgi:hypothetical protein
MFAVGGWNVLSQGLESYRARPPRKPLQQHPENRRFAFCRLAGIGVQLNR